MKVGLEVGWAEGPIPQDEGRVGAGLGRRTHHPKMKVRLGLGWAGGPTARDEGWVRTGLGERTHCLPRTPRLTFGARSWEDLFTTHFGREPGETRGAKLGPDQPQHGSTSPPWSTFLGTPIWGGDRAARGGGTAQRNWRSAQTTTSASGQAQKKATSVPRLPFPLQKKAHFRRTGPKCPLPASGQGSRSGSSHVPACADHL